MCITLTARNPVERIDIRMQGADAGSAALRRVGNATKGLLFHPARTLFLDEAKFPEPNLGSVDARGPDNAVSTGCTSVCNGAPDCVDLCFAAPKTHTVYASLPLEKLSTLTSFYDCDNPYATLVVADGDETGLLSDPPSDRFAGRIVKIAVRPPSIAGQYAGTLTYGDNAFGEVPFRFHLENCVVGNAADYPSACTASGAQLTGVINPSCCRRIETRSTTTAIVTLTRKTKGRHPHQRRGPQTRCLFVMPQASHRTSPCWERFPKMGSPSVCEHPWARSRIQIIDQRLPDSESRWEAVDDTRALSREPGGQAHHDVWTGVLRTVARAHSISTASRVKTATSRNTATATPSTTRARRSSAASSKS